MLYTTIFTTRKRQSQDSVFFYRSEVWYSSWTNWRDECSSSRCFFHYVRYGCRAITYIISAVKSKPLFLEPHENESKQQFTRLQSKVCVCFLHSLPFVFVLRGLNTSQNFHLPARQADKSQVCVLTVKLKNIKIKNNTLSK